MDQQMPKPPDLKQRLLLAAERLYSTRGMQSVSLRQIAAEAGSSNNSAVQYYFGSRAGLVNAIFHYRMDAMEEERRRLLREAEATGHTDDLRTLLLVICRPHIAIRDAAGRHTYARFLSQYLLDEGVPALSWHDERGRAANLPNLHRTQRLIADKLFYLPSEVVRRRLVATFQMFLSVVIYYDNHGRQAAGGTLDAALEDTLDQMVAAMALPMRTGERRSF
jgi:AcrR family transcriptional regulator